MREAAGASHWTCTDMRRSFGQTSEGESVHFWSREKDEEAIALGTFLEQRFAIGLVGERGRTCANGQELIHTYKEANNTDKRSKHIFNSLRTT